jgi:DNA-binding transcriptional LysR family regulator
MGRPLAATATATEGQTPGNAAPSVIGTSTIPTDLMRTFATLHELRNFTKTAQVLQMTQPAVSSQMKRLEAIVGADLIQKNVQGVRLTPIGLEVLRLGRRMLAVSDQILSAAGQQAGPATIRIGIPNIFAPSKLARILNECSGVTGATTLQVSCDHSLGLLREINSGYLDIVFVMSEPEELQGAWKTWSEELVWVRGRGLQLDADAVVPLISSPNLLLPDRIGIAALEQAKRSSQVVFKSFDTLARRSAAAAGLGYFPLARSLVAEPLVIEVPGVLPPLPPATLGLIIRDELNVEEMNPLLSSLQAVLMTDV